MMPLSWPPGQSCSKNVRMGKTNEAADHPPTRGAEEILADLPEEDRTLLIESLVVENHSFRSPLLPPEIMRQYGEVLPGLSEKLVEWTEEESKHRRRLEELAFEEAQLLRRRAQIAGPLVAIVSLAIAGLIGVLNPTAFGAAISAVVVIAGVGGPFAARLLANRWNSDVSAKELD